MDEEKKSEPKFKKIVLAANDLSLGISIIVAILLGVAVGFWLKSMFGYAWLLWLGIFWGVSAAGLNIYKAYKKQLKDFDEIKNDPRRAKAKDDTK